MAEGSDDVENVIEQDGRRFVDAEYISRLLKNSNVDEDARQQILEGLQGGIDHEDSDSSMSDYGELEQPPIRQQLKNILQAYPDGSQILRELVQNAEDANASIVRIVHDQRQIEVDLNRKRQLWLKSFKTPAVFLYNDELFRKNDWKGIRKVYSSGKEEDSLKIGRYGLGFKSVFHMTDTPIIISGDRLLMISPLEDQSWKVCHTIQLKKVFNKRKYHKLKEMLDQILGPENALFGIKEESFRKGNFKGTLFWFPLRQSIPVEDPISRTIYTQNKVDDLFHSFHREASMVLLFLKHVEQISLHTLEENSTWHEMFSVEIKSCNNENISKERRKISDRLKSCPQNHVVQKSIDSVFQARILLREESRSQETHWLISTVYQGSDEMSDEMRSLLDNNELRYQPYVGVALPFDRGGFSPHVFCFLPLPLEKEGQSLTNLPFHVNGSFALDSNRRHMNWPTNDRTEDKDVSLKWNRLMITEVLPTAYVNLMTNMVVTSHVQKGMIYKAMPDPEAVDKKWAILLPKLFSRLFEEPIFSTESGQHINFSEAVFSIISTTGNIGQCHTKNLLDTVQMYCPYLVRIPSEESHVFQILQSPYTPRSPKVITPKYINQLLLQDHEGKYKELSREHKLTLLVFLTSEGNFDYVDSLELMPVDSREKEFKVFERANTGKATYFLATQEQKEVLPELEDILLTPCDLKMPEAETVIETLSKEGLYGIKHITDDDIFQELLSRSLETITEKSTGTGKSFSLKNDKVGDHWLKRLWEYLSKHIDDFETVAHLPILPIFDQYGKFSHLQCLTGQYIAKAEHQICLSDSILHILQTLQICILHHVPDYVASCREYKKYVVSPTSDGILHILKLCLSSNSQIEMANKINRQCTSQDMLELAVFLTKNELPDELSEFMKRANLFETTENEKDKAHELGSVITCNKMLPSLPWTFPVQFPRTFLVFNKKTLLLAERLGVQKLDEMELVEVMLREIDNEESYGFQDVQQFMAFFLEYYASRSSEECLHLASAVRFMCNRENVPRKANHFFDPTDKDLQILFLDETSQFPTNLSDFSRNMIENCCKIGLRSSKDVQRKDLLEVARNISNMRNASKMRMKSEMLVTFMERLDNRSLLLMKDELKEMKWVPVKQERQECYSRSLSWKGESSVVCTPGEVADAEYEYIIGSSLYVCSSNTKHILRQLSFSLEPSVQAVVRHWKHAIRSLCAQEVSDKLQLKILQYLSAKLDTTNAKFVAQEMEDTPCISINGTFISPKQIYFQTAKGYESVRLEPYRYLLPGSYSHLQHFFEELGSTRYLEVENLISVLHEIKNTSSDNFESTFHLIEDVLNLIVECNPDYDLLSSVILPIESSNTGKKEFSHVPSCVHLTDPSLVAVKFPKEIKVVSQQISGKVASALGVKDVLTKLMEIGAITKIQLPKEDSDELRRRRLAVLDRKELAVRCIYSLVQELDNRGCTSVQLLFDERKNAEIQNGHVCPKLGDFYGPSLWIRHDANSTERFGGEISLLKIISDLPCVFTKRSLTMFDVTGNIFDDKQSLAGNGVGIQIGFDSENAWLLKAFPNTFTVYQDMCGRNFIDDPRQLSSFATTLYRLPLRSGNMESGENTAHFTSGNIKEILETLSHEFEDLLIFADNLKNLQICSISGNDADTQNKTDLYHANSQTLHTVVKDDSLLEEKSINVQNNCREVNIQTKRQHCATTWLVSKCGKGSVALLKENDDDIAMGFDKHHTPGKVFNIFPLDEMTDLPIYINGSFELHDHKIDRSTSVAVEGSKKILRTDVASSYVFLIYHLCSYPVLSETNLFSLWPRYSNDNVFDEVVRAFYDNIFHSNIELFTCKTGRQGLQQVCFLDFELRYKEPIGEIAQACFSELYNEPGKQNIDIPKSIHEQFETTNLVSRLHILQEEEFWTEVFLPSLSTNYWDQKQSQRNKLIAYCIQRSINLNLTSIIQKTWCVPTSPNGKLARPCDLVHLKPGSVLNGLFSEKDGRFVQDLDEFNSKEMREQLFRLGMMMETIHEDVLKERANSVATLYSSDPTESESRYSALLAYLKSLKNEEFAQAISAIRTIAWIPTAQTFSPYPSSAKWYGEESTHCNMDEGYLFKHRYLVGAIAYVYRDDKVLESLISRQPGEREVIDNLLRVIGDFNEDKYERGYDEIVHEAYSFFTKLNDISSDSINRLKLQKCVWTGHKFVVPAKVCLEFCLGIKKESLVPFMYCFDNQFEGIKWNPFFQTIGCHERLTLEHILQILESTNDVLQLHETGQEDLDNLLDVVLAILDTISKTELSKDHKDRLMLPVKFQNSWKMCKLLECAYISDESHLLMATSDDDANILVGKIGIETAEQLGVQSLSQRLLKDNDAEEMFCDWGQSEPLTTRIKRLLEEYSDGFSIPKELLQNADDAGATELTFIYDERENNDLRTGLLDEGMAECQGPALWVYSNSLFEEADFQNIIKLDGKTKVEETSKIGKFGLGFCSVYNMTDVPSFVSGKSIVIFDPNTFHLGKAIRDKSSPGLRIKFTKGSKEFLKRFRNQFMPYNGICECDLSGEDDVPFFNGTLFRFPFRTKLQASKSEIADRPYKQSDVKELLHQFIASAGNLLLFTPNVHTIKVKHITEKAGTQNISDLCDIRKENVSNRPERPFLREVAQMDNDYLKENTAKEICEVHISLQTTEHAKNVLEMSEINSSCNWLISYSSGSRDSIQMAENLSSEGAVSVGSVAIPREYLLSNDDYSLNGALRGFYKESHIFCFLPLPIETNLPVHINGSFFVEQSRRGLRQCAGTDNKSTKDVDRWNEMLLSDAVCDSYLGLLQALPSDYYSNENGLPRDSNFDYSRFWPALFEDSVLRPLSQNFYEQVVKGDHQLLYSQIPFDTKIAMKNCIFLEANVRYDQSIGDVAFKCLQNFHSEEDYCLMDMKKSIYDRFCEAGLKGSLRFLSTRDFFATVVLPNLTNEFWTNRETERDNMMVFLLKLIEVEEMPDLSNAMNQFDCIPTRPNGKLVKPHDLVDENSRLIADLFSDDDERFIQYDRNRGFKDDVVQSNLIAMGMMTNSISDDLIVSRAESIQQVSDRKRRCEAFIRYLESLADQHLQNLEFRLKNVAWIPVIEDKPFDYPSCLKWNGQSVKLQCPSNVYSEKYRHVVGSCANIHDKDIAELLQRMNFSQKPSVKLVLEHFRAMISLDDVTECNKLTQSVHDVYKYLYENLDDLQTNDTFDEDLYPEPLVWTGNMFIEAKHVCCQFCLGIARTALEPYIYKLVDEFTYMKPLFVFFGCSAELSFDHLLEIQKQINTKNNNADAEEDRRVMLNIVTDIAFKFKPDRHEDLKQLQLPVIHGEDRELKLASVTECVFTTDNFFLNNAEESAQQIHIMDRRIGIEVAEKLGVESLASRIMKDNDAEELGEEWGQSEPLTTRLKGLLEDYNDGFAIPKELVQNSDDAGATTVRFLYDERTNDEYMTGLIDEGMSECQGPALWVFNDACFTEDDFKNIIKLAGKTKESERSKIGKFGLGFSSVYNLTDVPSFVSGNSVVILDPKTVHLNKALRNKSSPGIRLRFGQQNQWLLKKLKNQFMPFQNIFGCDMSGTNNEPLDFKGTLFRLPLRTRKQAQDDAISSQAYSKKEMIKLLQKFASSVGTLMTFTQNIHKIEVYRLPETAAEPGESVLLFEASREKIGGTGRFNMLQEIVDECLKSHSSSRKTSVEVEMNIRTTRAASELLGVETDSWKYRWFITTSTGSMETLQMAKELSDKGAVPIGSVAISDAHIKSCSKLKEEPMGFEGNNRLFCFLPLPISKITLSVFVNGCFFVEKNRKCLHLPIGDDRMSHDKELEWNQTLLSDAVRDAYISLIAEIPMEYFEQDADGNALYQIWPRFSDNREIFEPLTREFYQSITSYAAGKRIFEIQNQKIGMNQCIFLDFSLRYKEFIGNAAHDFLVYLDTPTLKTVIDMPQEIYEQFKEASCDDKLPILTTLEFFSAYFFENINSDFWNGKESSRNSLVLYALSEFSEKADLLAKISVAPCIPTRPHGLLRRPSELISEVHCSVLKDLFSEADERFIQSSDSQHFSDSKIMDVLVRLGLKTDFLPKELLCERAESVIKQGTPDKQISRCEAVLQYIQKHANTDLPYTDMKSIKFLPVQEKPENWPMKWHSAQEIDTGDQGNFKIQFEKPENIASQYLKCIVGSVLPILQMSLESKFSHNVFLQLGLKTRGKLSIDDAIGQLRHISETSPSSVEERIMKEICEETYSFIGENIMEYQDVDLSEFKERKMIYAGNKLVKPRECIIWLPVECQPEFYCMKNVWSTTSSELLTFLRSAGVRDLENTEDEKCLNINDILGVLKKFEINIGNRVEENVVILIINLLTTLDHLAKQDRNYHLPNEVIEQLFAPDMNNIIRRPTDICIDDNYDKLSDEPNLHIVHDKMTRGLLRLLKIKTKRAQYISQFDFGVSFGQEEKLTTRIRGILEDHPSEISVFNELLQNADDASATEIVFILDKRVHGTKHIFDDTMKETQGPALCVYNDSSFTQDDIEGISRLGEGSKRYDSSKTGQFGIGFNAVYNVTDVPSILTKGPETPNGGTLIVFDPHRRYFPESSQPGIRVPDLDIIEQKYPDVFAAHLQNDKTFKKEEGTWFRFPLRDSKMAASSEIKPMKTMTTDRIEELMSTFVGNAEKSLLFMTTLRNISVFVIRGDGACVQALTMSASLQPDCLLRLKDFKENVKTHMGNIKSDVKAYTETEVITYDLDITENDQIQNRWRIVQNFNAYSGIPDVLIDAIQKGTIRLSPRGGVAFRLTPKQSSLKPIIYKRTKENIPEEHSAFSFLPLSMESTGLPLHVNGHFVLHSSRTSIWEDEDVKRTTLQGQWNHFLLSSVIPCSYIELMKSQVKDIMDSSGETREPLNTYYSMFPEQAKCSSNTWKILVTGVYQMLIDLQILAMPILSYPSRDTTSIRWVCLYKRLACPIYFDNILHEYESRDYEKINEKLNVFLPMHSSSHHDEEERRAKALALSKVFKEIGMKLVDVPLWVMDSIIESNCSVGEDIFHPECIAPISAINFLKSWSSNLNDKCALDRVDVKVNETPIKTVDRVKQMLGYCFHKGKNAEDMDGTPLLVNESKELKVFSTENKLYVSRFAHLLPASRQLFVHKTLVNCLNTYRKSFCLKELTFEDFAELIHLSIDEAICTVSPHILTTSQSDILNGKWISGFWNFLQSRAEVENIDTCKQILGKWTFIPSKRATSDRTTLYSFEEGHAILDIETFRSTSDNGVANALEQLRLPKPHSFETDISINLIRKFIATSDKPVEVLKCLYYHRFSFDQIENVNPLKILQYFTLKMESLRSNSEAMEMLSELPLHATINNKLTRLSSAYATIILTGIGNRMPRDGLSKLMNVTNTVFLRDNPNLHDLYYSFLGTRKCNEFQFYIEYVLPNLQVLEINDRVAQLMYVRNNLNRGNYNSSERERLRTTLLSCRFIYCPESNCIQKAMHFYSPHVRLFALLCEQNELPPAPFNGLEWKELMIISGMITNAPYQRILEFAEHVQNKRQVTGEVEELSKLVVQHVFRRINMSDLECLSFLDSLCSVRFLCPHRVQGNLHRIYPQHNQNALIAFRNSVLSKGQKLGWTTCELLPEYADPTLCLTGSTTEIQRHLGYLNEPSTRDCLNHIHNVCHHQQQGCLVNFEKGINKCSSSMDTLMESIYKFLNSKTSRTDIDDLRRMLSETPFIFVFQHNLFLTVDQVVLKLDQEREIRPYLCSGPERFGQYFDLFRTLGCRDKVKAFHYANIVRTIYLRVNVGQEDCPLTPDELDKVRNALVECFNVLDENDHSLEALEEFYLPSEQGTLFKSTSLIFNDRPGYKRRLQRHETNELRYVKHMKNYELEKKLLQLPQRLRPVLLSDVISEQLYLFAECDAESNLMRLQSVMQSCQFVDAILIISNEDKHRIGEEEEIRIRSRLASLRLQPVSSLTTILVHESTNILSSEEEKDLFWTKENQQIVIYIKNSTEKYRKWVNRIFNRLANVVMMCTCNRQIPTDMLKEILDVEDPNEIPSLMLEYTTYTTTESQTSWLPDPGSPVPLHFHDLLDNSLNGDSVRFKPGEIAVYEMYDKSIDDNDPNGDAEFIYVKIVRILENDSIDEFFQMYEIYDGHSKTSVYSFRLYKMIRHPDPSRQEMVVFTDGHEDFTNANRDGIFNEIRKTLARAWRRDRNDFKRIMKRMLLKWHPDKNLSEKEFCTEVTQFILDIVRRLENGEDVFNEKENCSYNRWRESYRRRDFSNWSYGSSSGSAYAFGAGVSGSARRRRQRYSDYSDSYSHNVPPNPQPASAKRWLQQAKCDLDSANREIERERQGNQRDQDDDAQRPIFNWICYKAHQAAEKALKARVLNNDANKLSGRSFTSHDLLNLAMFGHDDLRQLAREFRDQVVPEHTAMRYPQNFTQGKIPTDMFEEKDAEKAIELAEKIIDIVDSEM